ncbi:MAG: hypothetical protein WC841_04165 [Candidatus Shapirobacteria bacterium]|jgi:hypothetical protein
MSNETPVELPSSSLSLKEKLRQEIEGSGIDPEIVRAVALRSKYLLETAEASSELDRLRGEGSDVSGLRYRSCELNLQESIVRKGTADALVAIKFDPGDVEAAEVLVSEIKARERERWSKESKRGDGYPNYQSIVVLDCVVEATSRKKG